MEKVLHKLQLMEAALPETIMEYVSKSMPEITATVGGWRVFGGMSFVSENYHASPSIFIRQFGHWTIARSDNGDAACLDSNSGSVRIFDTGAFIGKQNNEGFVIIKSQLDNKKLMRDACDASNVLLFVKNTFASLNAFCKELGVGPSEMNTRINQ